MEAKLTAPALTAWLIVGMTICLVWGAPWYVGAAGGLAAAAVVYVVWGALKPKFDHAAWAVSLCSSLLFAALAIAWLAIPTDVQVGVFVGDAQFAVNLHVAFAAGNALIALRHFFDGITDWRRSRQPTDTITAD